MADLSEIQTRFFNSLPARFLGSIFGVGLGIVRIIAVSIFVVPAYFAVLMGLVFRGVQALRAWYRLLYDAGREEGFSKAVLPFLISLLMIPPLMMLAGCFVLGLAFVTPVLAVGALLIQEIRAGWFRGTFNEWKIIKNDVAAMSRFLQQGWRGFYLLLRFFPEVANRLEHERDLYRTEESTDKCVSRSLYWSEAGKVSFLVFQTEDWYQEWVTNHRRLLVAQERQMDFKMQRLRAEFSVNQDRDEYVDVSVRKLQESLERTFFEWSVLCSVQNQAFDAINRLSPQQEREGLREILFELALETDSLKKEIDRVIDRWSRFHLIQQRIDPLPIPTRKLRNERHDALSWLEFDETLLAMRQPELTTELMQLARALVQSMEEVPRPRAPAPRALALRALALGALAPGALAPGALAPGALAPGAPAPGAPAPGAPAPRAPAPIYVSATTKVLMTEAEFAAFELTGEELEAIKHVPLLGSKKLQYALCEDAEVKRFLALYQAEQRRLNEALCCFSLEPHPANEVMLIKQYVKKYTLPHGEQQERWFPVLNDSIRVGKAYLHQLCCESGSPQGCVIVHPCTRDTLFSRASVPTTPHRRDPIPEKENEGDVWCETRYRYHRAMPATRDVTREASEQILYSQELTYFATRLEEAYQAAQLRSWQAQKISQTDKKNPHHLETNDRFLACLEMKKHDQSQKKQGIRAMNNQGFLAGLARREQKPATEASQQVGLN